MARIDGLKHQLEVMTATVKSRFLEESGDRPSMARTLSFMGRPEHVSEMADAVVRDLRLKAIDVEESALSETGYQRYAVTVALAPLDEEGSS